MTELFAGVIAGLGLFVAGMWLLTENLKALASRRLRGLAARWTANPASALLWGCLAGGITQSMSAFTFIVVSILRSGLIAPKGAFILILGGGIGISSLVVIVTFDIKVAASYVLGAASIAMASERLSRYRNVAASFLGGAMIVVGLVLLQEAAAPLAGQPWFQRMLANAGNSLALAFLASAFLTAVVQSSSAVSVFAIGLSGVGVLSADQTIAAIYGSVIGSAAVIYLLSTGLSGRSRQVAMYLVTYNAAICAVLVPMLYLELHFGIPLVKALVFSADLEPGMQLALVYVFLSVFFVPAMLAGLGPSVRAFERLWPASQTDQLSRPRFLHDHASVDVDSSVLLADLEQRRALASLSGYFEAVRQRQDVPPLREALRRLLADISGFLDELQVLHPMQSVEELNGLRSRQKLLIWLEDSTGTLCETLIEPGHHPEIKSFQANVCESVDSVLLSLVDAMESDDAMSWGIARQLAGDRGELMRSFRVRFLGLDPPLRKLELINALLITNAVEEIFFLFAKMEQEYNPASQSGEHYPRR